MQLDGHSAPFVDAYDTPVRAVVVGPDGEPRSRTSRSPTGRASSCGCSPAGSAARTSRSSTPLRGPVLGHEVVARLSDGRRVALGHHAPAASATRCRAGHESPCERIRGADDPARAASRSAPARSRGSSCRTTPTTGAGRWSSRSPASSVGRGRSRAGGCSSSGRASSARSSPTVLRHRGGEVFAVDSDPRRPAPRPTAPSTRSCSQGRAASTRPSTRSRRAGRSSSSPMRARSRPRRCTGAS